MINKKFRRILVSVMITGTLMAPLSGVKALSYDPNANYYALMQTMIERGDPHSLYAGRVFENLRNEKIDAEGLKYKKTTFFTDYTSVSDIKLAMDLHQRGWIMDDYDLLSRLINAEAGANWTPDWVMRAVGSVVLNRVQDRRYPNTIKDVIYQPYQYGPVYNGSLYKPATERSKANARYILLNGKTLPDGVIGQNGNPSGPVYSQWYDYVLGTTIYFHY